MSRFKSPIIWATAFFGTLWAFSIGYSAFVTNFPATAVSGSGVSATEWNKISPALQALDNGLSNFSFAGGNVGIWAAAPDHKLQVSGDVRLDTGYKLRFWAIAENSDDAYVKRVNPVVDQTDIRLYVHDNNDDNDRFSIWGNSCGGWACSVESAASVRHWFGTSGNAWHAGAVNATAFNVTSDERLKKNIETFPDALETVSGLRGVTFEWKDPLKWNGTQVGFIAQEVEKQVPALVRTGADGYKSVQYANVTAVLVEAVKELKKENEELKSRIENLEANR